MTLWKERRPGETIVSELDELEAPAVLVAAPEATDWMKLPESVDPRQRQRRVLETFRRACPMCGTPVLHFRLDGEWFVAECRRDGFVIYRLDGESVAEALAGES